MKYNDIDLKKVERAKLFLKNKIIDQYKGTQEETLNRAINLENYLSKEDIKVLQRKINCKY